MTCSEGGERINGGGGGEGGILPTQVYALNWITLNDLYVAEQTICNLNIFHCLCNRVVQLLTKATSPKNKSEKTNKKENKQANNNTTQTKAKHKQKQKQSKLPWVEYNHAMEKHRYRNQCQRPRQRGITLSNNIYANHRVFPSICRRSLANTARMAQWFNYNP